MSEQTGPRTTAGLNLWEWFESDALPLDEFGFATGKDAIVAIEAEALADASFLPLAEIERLRTIERVARAAVEAEDEYSRRVNERAVTHARTTMGWLRTALSPEPKP